MSDPETIGTMLARAREASGLSLKALGKAVGGLSPQFMHDVEKDRRRIAVEHWPALVRALPGLDLQTMAEASLATGTVEIDARSLTVEQRKILATAIVRAATEAGKKGKAK